MQKVVTINLNGHAYQLDESAYEILRAYLDHAGEQLRDNPDRAEILADFEQAIAEKCARFLGPNKTVVSEPEIKRVVDEMGPVEGTSSAPQGQQTSAAHEQTRSEGPSAAKRLYRIRQGAMFAGVCTGLAAYFGVDVVIVRILFAIVGAITFGWAFMGYWVLMFIIPEARTAEEHSAAFGAPPFNAQEIIDQAKKTASDFKDTARATQREWKQQWREQQQHWRDQNRAWREQWRHAGPWATNMWGGPIVSPSPWLVTLMPLFTAISLIVGVALTLSIVSVVTTGALFGWPLPIGIPMWAAIIGLIGISQVLVAPIRAARHSSHYWWPNQYAWIGLLDGLVGAAVVGGFIWLLGRHMSPFDNAHDFIRQVPQAMSALVQEIETWFRGAPGL